MSGPSAVHGQSMALREAYKKTSEYLFFHVFQTLSCYPGIWNNITGHLPADANSKHLVLYREQVTPCGGQSYCMPDVRPLFFPQG